MHLTALTPRRALAALVAPALLLSGCGSSDSDSAKDAAKEPAKSASTPIGNSDYVVLTKDTFTDAVGEASSGAGSFRVSQAMDFGPLMKLELETEAEVGDDNVRMHVRTTPKSSQQLEAVVADGQMYLKSAEMGLPDGKWLAIDPQDKSNPFAAFMALAAAPRAAAADLGTPSDVELVGTETVDGVEAYHYRVTTDVKGSLDKLGLDKMGLPKEIAGAMPDEAVAEMWLDSDNRMVKYHHEMAVLGITTTMDQRFYDFGADVTITPPKAADTVGMDQLDLSGILQGGKP